MKVKCRLPKKRVEFVRKIHGNTKELDLVYLPRRPGDKRKIILFPCTFRWDPVLKRRIKIPMYLLAEIFDKTKEFIGFMYLPGEVDNKMNKFYYKADCSALENNVN